MRVTLLALTSNFATDFGDDYRPFCADAADDDFLSIDDLMHYPGRAVRFGQLPFLERKHSCLSAQ